MNGKTTKANGQNICLYFSDTGGGHRSAVDAVEAALHQLLDNSTEKPAVNIVRENIAEKSHPLNRFFVELYNFLLRHHQPLMKHYYNFLHLLRPNESEFGYSLSKDYLQELLQKNEPSVVVSVHPMINHYVARALVDLNLKHKVKLVEVITDPNADLWEGWACPAANLIIAPNDIVRDKLISWGISSDRIQIAGMPVSPEFLKQPTIDRDSFLAHLGLSPNRMTVCLNAGWAGGGNMLRIYKALEQVDREIQVIFLCGHNTKLYEQAMQAAAESEIPTAVLPFHDCMSDLMSSVDMMVTKAGGLTTYQALAKKLPIVFDALTEPMPQEKGTVDMLVEHGLAKAIEEPSQVVPIVEAFTFPLNRDAVVLPDVHSLNRTDAIIDIATAILANNNPPIQLTFPVAEPKQPAQEEIRKSQKTA